MLLLQPFQEPLGSSSPDGAAAMETSFSLMEGKTEEGEDDEEGEDEEEEGEGSVAGLGVRGQLTAACEDFRLHKRALA